MAQFKDLNTLSNKISTVRAIARQSKREQWDQWKSVLPEYIDLIRNLPEGMVQSLEINPDESDSVFVKPHFEDRNELTWKEQAMELMNASKRNYK
jgi:hypothetical protein